MVADRNSGVLTDHAKVHTIDFEGKGTTGAAGR